MAAYGYYKPKMTRKEISKTIAYNVQSLREFIRETEVLFMMYYNKFNNVEDNFRMKFSAPLMTKEEFEMFPQKKREMEEYHDLLDRRAKEKYSLVVLPKPRPPLDTDSRIRLRI